MARYGLEIRPGVSIYPNDWIEVEFWDGRGVARGKFSGIWVNPNFGLVCYIHHLRFLKTPEVGSENYFFVLKSMESPKEEPPAFTMLRGAKIIPKPTRSKKKNQIPTGTSIH